MTQTVSSGTRVTPADLAAFCIEAMRVSGLNEEDARLTAEVLVTTDTLGTFTHGTRQLRGLLKNVRTGRLSATAHEEIAAEGPAWAMVDAHYAMPPAVSYRAMMLAMEKAGRAASATSASGTAATTAPPASTPIWPRSTTCSACPCVTWTPA